MTSHLGQYKRNIKRSVDRANIDLQAIGSDTLILENFPKFRSEFLKFLKFFFFDSGKTEKISLRKTVVR